MLIGVRANFDIGCEAYEVEIKGGTRQSAFLLHKSFTDIVIVHIYTTKSCFQCFRVVLAVVEVVGRDGRAWSWVRFVIL